MADAVVVNPLARALAVPGGLGEGTHEVEAEQAFVGRVISCDCCSQFLV